MKIKTTNLTRAALDWAVCRAQYPNADMPATHVWIDSFDGEEDFLIEKTSTDWSQGGPISEREGISSSKKHDGWWAACIYDINDDPKHYMLSHSRLEAEMRCYVASKLGDEVEVPDELGPTCPHCSRTLEDGEITTGLCTSDDCPRHDGGA